MKVILKNSNLKFLKATARTIVANIANDMVLGTINPSTGVSEDAPSGQEGKYKRDNDYFHVADGKINISGNAGQYHTVSFAAFIYEDNENKTYVERVGFSQGATGEFSVLLENTHELTNCYIRVVAFDGAGVPASNYGLTVTYKEPIE